MGASSVSRPTFIEQVHLKIWEYVQRGDGVPAAGFVAEQLDLEPAYVRKIYGQLVEQGNMKHLYRGFYRLLRSPDGHRVKVEAVEIISAPTGGEDEGHGLEG